MDELLRDFLTETSESLDLVDAELVRFEQEPNNGQILGNIFRLVHTIKGTCGFLGLSRLETLTHAAETLMGKFRDGMPVTAEAVTLILSTLDRIKTILDGLETLQREPDGGDADLIEQLGRMARGETRDAATRPAPDQPASATSRAIGAARTGVPARTPAAKVAAARQARGGRGRQARQPFDPRQRRHARSFDDHGLGAGAHPQSASRDRAPARGFRFQGAAAAALQRHRRAAGRRDEDAHAADRQCVAETAAHRARPVRRARQGHRARNARRRNRARPPGARTGQGSAHPSGAQLRRSRHRSARRADRRRQAARAARSGCRACHQGGHIIIEIADDGRGLDLARIKAKAIELGLASEAEIAAKSDGEICNFIFSPGFTTAAEVTSISGRGVGMDVVRSNIEQIGGTVDLKSVAGAGTTFTIKIPLTLAIVSALIVEAGGERFAIPQLVGARTGARRRRRRAPHRAYQGHAGAAAAQQAVAAAASEGSPAPRRRPTATTALSWSRRSATRFSAPSSTAYSTPKKSSSSRCRRSCGTSRCFPAPPSSATAR